MKEWITGRNPVYEVLKAGRRQVFRLLVARGVEEKGRLMEIISLAARRKAVVERVPRQQLDLLASGAESHQGVALEVSGFPYSFLSDILKAGRTSNEPLFILMLDMIQNPQNLGSLIRSAEAVGVHGVVLPLARAAGITPAVVHASSGAVEHVQVCQSNLAQAIAECKEAGAWVVGLEGGDRAQPAESIRLDGSLVLVVGNEGEGIRPLVARSCDVLMRLPMRGKVDSLNAAAAGTVALYLALMARRQGK